MRARRVSSRAVRTLIAACAAAVMLISAATALAATAQPPATDPFYQYSGSLASVAPGTVLKTRAITLNVAGVPSMAATEVLYRTTDQIGDPEATVATIIRPTNSTGATKIISYQTFYDGVSSTCRPSYTLQGGGSQASTGQVDVADMVAYVQAGYTVVTTDYEGATDDYGAGQESGMATLDGIRATESLLGVPAKTTPVGMVGYSGGATATEWAAELQPTYAPELDIVGTAAGGIPVDFLHSLDYISGTSDWAGAIPSVMVGLMRGYHVDFNTYLNANGMAIVQSVEQGCLNPFADPHLTLAQMLKPQYQNWQQVPIFEKIFNNSIMSTGGTPAEPMLMAVGNFDGTGDGVMIAADVQELAHIYCQRGVAVQLHIYDGMDHYEVIAPFEALAVQFFQQRFAGDAPTNGCSSIGPGDALTPLPVTSPATPTATPPRILALAPVKHAGLFAKFRVRLAAAAPLTIKVSRRQIRTIKGHKHVSWVAIGTVFNTHVRTGTRTLAFAAVGGKRLSAGVYRLTASTTASTRTVTVTVTAPKPAHHRSR